MILTELSITDVNDLKTEANNFDQHANEIKKITDQMLELVDSTISCWRGTAQSKYSNQFKGLTDDMKVIYDMCHEYYTDLVEIAKNYETAESDNEARANSLKADVNLVQG
ncbi:WXG100 family type VII secretion target [Butyrivibrio sp. YAB3001]|uniref:WXG100 family type VII secretion target n=1 Tax=Butyrivibrio sp. YAB3001 TaxID=1520812 RepID=UPI0008F67A0C|nr:WXG100 family type VII secretion target [Butyrivibrio sp. YAB3001]SFB82371.1 WXG100 family type VII secretion target [Butyrivibrio sp. YAB3001]